MAIKDNIWNMFVAAMVHDIGKLSGDPKFGKHENLRYIGKEFLGDENIFDDILGREVVDLIENHHNGLIDQNDPFTLNCIKLADRIQKSLHGIEETEEFYKIKSLQFYPYYKYPITWEKNKTIDILKSISEELKNGVNVLRSILSIQNKLGYYPHTRYIPHISLAIHHQLSAVLSIFLYQNLKASNLDDFKFYVVQVNPDQVSLFYRLRDVIAHKNIARELTNRIYRELFVDYANSLRGIMPVHNPFVFYSIDGIVFLHNDYERIISSLQKIVNTVEGLRSLNVRIIEYTIPINKILKTSYADPSDIKFFEENFSILSNEIIKYEKNLQERCELCGKSIKELYEDDKNNKLCKACYNLRNNFSSKIDIDEVSKKKKAERIEDERIAYVFLTFPDDLIIHSKEIAKEKMINSFIRLNFLTPESINPSKIGLMEFLQALMEIKNFQSDLEGAIKEIKLQTNEEYSAFVVYELPNSMLYLLREDLFWKYFIGYLHEVRSEFKLDSSAKIILCRPKTPFWSLIKDASNYVKGDVFYDISGGNVIMFTTDEVNKIRELAEKAKRYKVFPTQLERVSEVALYTTKDELELEIDARSDRLRGFEKELKEGIEKIDNIVGSEGRNKEKRSIFIKYIAKLARR